MASLLDSSVSSMLSATSSTTVTSAVSPRATPKLKMCIRLGSSNRTQSFAGMAPVNVQGSASPLASIRSWKGSETVPEPALQISKV